MPYVNIRIVFDELPEENWAIAGKLLGEKQYANPNG